MKEKKIIYEMNEGRRKKKEEGKETDRETETKSDRETRDRHTHREWREKYEE